MFIERQVLIMNVKDYLSQGFRIYKKIYTKTEQIQQLSDLATKCTVELNGMPSSGNKGNDKVGDTVAKICDMQNKLVDDINHLVDIRVNIYDSISQLDRDEYALILEKRYILYESWEVIAVDLDYDLRYLHRLHKKALAAVEPFLLDKIAS